MSVSKFGAVARRVVVRAMVAVALASVLTSVALAQSLPWKERHELSLNLQAPTTAERLAQATVYIVAGIHLTWNAAQNVWELDVHPWDTLNGRPSDPPLCQDPNDIFAGQPTPGWKSTGVLVGPDLVMTAGHVVAGLPVGPGCNQDVLGVVHIVLDNDWTGPAPPSGILTFPPEQVIPCVEVLANTHADAPVEDPDEIFGSEDPEAIDWALFRIATPVADRLPVPYAKNPPFDGAEVALLGHPARIPFKGETSSAASITSGDPKVAFHGLGGTSGSPIFDLATGKVFGVATNTTIINGWVFEECDPNGQNCCLNPCFECAPVNVAYSRTSLLQSVPYPSVGLRLDPEPQVVDYYGPPTTPADYPTWSVTLKNSAGAEAVDWYVTQDQEIYQVFDISGPWGGNLPAGALQQLDFFPTQGAVQAPGEVAATSSFFDTTYGSRTYVQHVVHSGVEGFVPGWQGSLVGEGPGAPSGTTEKMAVVNRWIVSQPTSVSTDQPWIKIDGAPGPVTVAVELPASGMEDVNIELDGSGMLPGVYEGTIEWTSDDSGTSPPWGETRDVRMDYCRQITALPGPEPFTVGPGQPATIPLQVSTAGSVEDVDIAVGLTQGGSSPRGQDVGTFKLTVLTDAGGDSAVLHEDFPKVFETIFDDATNPPFEPLSTFLGANAADEWQLKIETNGTVSVSGTVSRFEVRLHVDPPIPCP